MSTQEKMDQYTMQTYKKQEVCLVSGKGATATDEQGKTYIDFGSGIGVNALGYAPEQWAQAVALQAQTLQHTSNLYYTKPAAELAQALCERTGYQKVFFANSGAEANEGAIKLARKYSHDRYGAKANRNKVVSLVNSFHGRTITTLAATGQEVFHQNYFPFTPGFVAIPANETSHLAEALDEQVCAVIIEFIQGEGGVIPLTQAFIAQLVALCQERDILIIADEVQTGVGRTGTFLTSEQYGFQPDITTLAKGLGGGLPIGAFLCNEKLANVFQYGDHGTTFGGNPVACAGALVILQTLDDALLAEVREKSDQIKTVLQSSPEVGQIDGLGLMLGIELKTKTAPAVLKECLANGVIVLSAKEKVRLLPPLNITKEELNQGLEILLHVLNTTNH